ncbi:MAG: hypothetical protein II835_12380, partial [Fibrobacter sp.]|nr:hypothetical protein [Fibrobacter sp.]
AITEEDIKSKLTLSTSAIDTLKFLAAHAGIEMDEGAMQEFIAQRNVRMGEISQIWELKAWCEKTVDFIKTVCKHAFNVGSDEELPKSVSWSKQTFTEKFTDAGEAVQKLIEIEGTPIENFARYVTPKQAAEAAGITMDRLYADLGDMVERTPKERTLKIK